MKDNKVIQLQEATQTLIKRSQALQQESLALRASLKINMVVLRTSMPALKATNDIKKKYFTPS